MSNDNRPTCQIKFLNSYVTALWDTGSTLTLLTLKHFKRIFPLLEIQRRNTTLKSASGHKLNILGTANIPFTIENVTHGKFPFVIIESMTQNCILGFDFFKEFLIYIHPPTGHAFTMVNPQLPSHVLQPGVNCYLAHDTCVNGREQKWVTATTHLNDGTYSINDDNNLIPNTLAIITPSLVTVSSNKLKLLVSNPTLTPLHLSQNCQLGILRPKIECIDISEISAILPSSTPTSTKDIAHLVNFNTIPQYIRRKFIDLLKNHKNLLNDDSSDIGKCSLIKQKIVLKDPNKLACTPPHRIPPPLQPVVNHFVDKLLAAKVIQPSNSPFSSPLMLIKKAGADSSKPLLEQYRVVNDFRKLNSNIVKDSYPMQNIYSLIDEVAAAKIASVIDLRSAFFMQELEDSSKKYTSFPVPGMGHFEYNRSPQGLINSPSSFQRLLDALLLDIPNVKVYIDDIVIYNNTWEDHLETLHKVLSKLSKHNFKCSVKKLQLACGTINYLGYEIKPGISIRPGQAKTEAISKWQAPTDLTQVKQFMGLCSFFRRTIPNF